MKRMIHIWFLSIVVLFAVGFVRSDWSVFANNWSLSLLILLLMMLGIEIGLYFWRRKMIDLSQFVKNSQTSSTRIEQETHYVPPENSA